MSNIWPSNDSEPPRYPGETHYYSNDKMKPPLPYYRRYVWQILVAVLVLAIIILSVFTVTLLNKPSVTVKTVLPAATLVPTSIPTQTSVVPTTVPTQPPVATQTPAPQQQGAILCQDWSKWTLSSHWSTLNGVLINDGSDSYTTWLAAPCQPGTKDYAVESEMKIDQGCNAHGLVARAVGPNNYAAGAYCLGGDVEIWLWGGNATSHQDLAHHNFSIGTAWHTYRLEVKGNELKLLIDGTVMCDIIDDTILSGAGQVGIWSQSEQLEVRSFKIIAL